MGDENLSDTLASALPATREIILQIGRHYFPTDDYRINWELSHATFSHLIRVMHRPTKTNVSATIEPDIIHTDLSQMVGYHFTQMQEQLFHYRAKNCEEFNLVHGPLAPEVESLLALMDAQCVMFDRPQNATMAYFIRKRGAWAQRMGESMLTADLVRWQVFLSSLVQSNQREQQPAIG